MPAETSPYQTVVITSTREEVPGVKTFTIASENGTEISYAAGQFITFVFTHHGREERRSFSISSSPVLNEPLSFTVKRIDNGAYSRLLNDRGRTGDKLLTTGAAGLFTIPRDIAAYDQVFFLAAGIGITPVFSIIKTLLHSHPGKQIVLIYSSRARDEAVFYNELMALSEKFRDNFRIAFLYSTSFNLERARLSKALLPLLLEENGLYPKEKLLFYICGPFNYMRMAVLSLEEQGIDEEQIKKENFNTNDRVVVKVQPPDTSPHNISIKHGGRTDTFGIQYPETILQVARKHGLAIPYSCEVGRCGSCAAMCTSGKIWMSYNEALMDSDVRKGLILTCVGYPVDGDATIVI